MQNDLEAVTMARYPVLADIKAWLIERGAIGSLMSGSGPTVFGVFRETREAEEAGSLARGAWRDCWVAVTEVQEAPYPER
jgi:4-diphosphocytidyl-2-C-methyl-D-erythritol kinase